MDKKIRDKVKKWLPFGGQTEVARHLGVSQSLVSQVLSGDVDNRTVEDALIELAKKNKVALYNIQQEQEEKAKPL